MEAQYNEEETLKSLSNGDERAFKRIFDIYSPPIFRTVNRFLKSQAQTSELVRLIFSALWNRRSTLGEKGEFHHVLNQLTKELFLDYFHRFSSSELAKYSNQGNSLERAEETVGP